MRTLVDCGCVARVHGDGSGIEIDYCPMHSAASGLLEACKGLLMALGMASCVIGEPEPIPADHPACISARAAIKKAEEH